MMRPAKPLKIFFMAMDSVGHMNACIGMAKAMAKRGHQIIFLTDLVFAGHYEKFGFGEIVLINKKKQEIVAQQLQNGSEDQDSDQPGDSSHPLKATRNDFIRLRETGMLSGKPSIEKLQLFDPNKEKSLHRKLYEELMEWHPQIVSAIEQQRPDLIIVDSFVIDPFIAFGNTPWALLSSCNPNFLFESPDLPPIHSGYPSDDRTGWQEFRDRFNKSNKMSMRYWQNKLNQDLGFPQVDYEQYLFKSPYMNIYAYPEELDYTDVIQLPDNVVRMDAFTLPDSSRETPPFELPDEFTGKIQDGDKLIYLSLGSMGAIDVDLMRKLVGQLAKSRHKFIISKGLFHDQYGLAENMWGQAYVPQTSILPLVDMVITHGGNNTITEALSFGKPMLVMPLFSDQYDNAQRIQERGYGKRVDPHAASDEELLSKIDGILNDPKMLERCERAGRRMREAGSQQKACERIEQLVEANNGGSKL